MSRSSTPRPWRSATHLETTITGEAGAIHISPLRADEIHFDAAWSNSYPDNLPEARNGSHVLDIGRGVLVRAIGNVRRDSDGQWVVSHLTAKQYPNGRELSRQMAVRARGVITQMIGDWAATHEGDLAQADDVDRNNSAQHLEKQIAEHEAALELLREQLTACEEGEPFTQFPELPTDQRR